MPPSYIICHVTAHPDLNDEWSGASWSRSNVLEVMQYRREGSGHCPQTRVRMLYDDKGLYGAFRVHDRFVRSTRTEFQGEVWKDSCVEFFVQPRPDAGYFNFEINCGGALLCSYVTDPTRTATGLKERVLLPKELGELVHVRSTLPRVVDPELADPTIWEVKFFVPFKVLEPFVGPLGKLPGAQWRGNFYKCAEDNSHPHWGAWAPVDELNFHLPRCFGTLVFSE